MEGFVNEHWSYNQEPRQAPSKFLIAGRKPQVGMRIEANIYVKDGSWFRLSGLVSEIGATPTNLDLDMSNSSSWHVDIHDSLPCPNPKTCPFRVGSSQEKKDEMIARYGAIHGQRIKSVAIISRDYEQDYLERPVAREDVVELTLVCDDNKLNVWQVKGIEILNKDFDLPTYFHHFIEWYGNGMPCQCRECHSTLKEVSYGNGCNCVRCRAGESCSRLPILAMDLVRSSYSRKASKTASIVSLDSSVSSISGYSDDDASSD